MLVLATYLLQYRGHVGPDVVEAYFEERSTSVECTRGWRVFLVSGDPAYLFNWTYRCRVDWKPGLGETEQLGVEVDDHGIVDQEI